MRGAGRNHGQVDPIRNTTTAGGACGVVSPPSYTLFDQNQRAAGGRAVFLHTEEILENGENCKSITGHRSGRRPRSGEPMRQQAPGADQERGTDQGREIPERIREGKR